MVVKKTEKAVVRRSCLICLFKVGRRVLCVGSAITRFAVIQSQHKGTVVLQILLEYNGKCCKVKEKF